MKISKDHFVVSLMSFLITFTVHGQNQTGFISLDCGLPRDAEYFDERTAIYYTSDASFIESDVNNTILPSIQSVSVDQQFHTLRSFPQGTRNCFTVVPAHSKGNKYLIRARFMCGNYDGKGQLPEFDLHLGVELWDTVTFSDVSIPTSKEIIQVASSSYIHVCLVNTGRGTPFISALELRPLNNSMYATTWSLNLVALLDLGSTENQVIKYLWQAKPTFLLNHVTTCIPALADCLKDGNTLVTMVAGLLATHPGLEFLQGTPKFQERYGNVLGDR